MPTQTESETVMSDQSTLLERVDDEREVGCRCPTCHRFLKIYKRHVYRAMATDLVRLYRLQLVRPDDWIHIRDFNGSNGSKQTGGGDFAKLRYWGLVVAKPNDDTPSKRHVGFWKISQKGCRYVCGGEHIPKYARIYLDECIGFEGPLVKITNVIPFFDYQDLMSQ